MADKCLLNAGDMFSLVPSSHKAELLFAYLSNRLRTLSTLRAQLLQLF